MITINAEMRKEQGKSASRRLRHAGKFPAIIYGNSKIPVAVELDHNEILNLQAKPEFYTEVIDIVIDGNVTKAKIQSMQRHPYKPKVMHIDFIRV